MPSLPACTSHCSHRAPEQTGSLRTLWLAPCRARSRSSCPCRRRSSCTQRRCSWPDRRPARMCESRSAFARAQSPRRSASASSRASWPWEQQRSGRLIARKWRDREVRPVDSVDDSAASEQRREAERVGTKRQHSGACAWHALQRVRRLSLVNKKVGPAAAHLLLGRQPPLTPLNAPQPFHQHTRLLSSCLRAWAE